MLIIRPLFRRKYFSTNEPSNELAVAMLLWKFWRLSSRDRMLVLEAAVCLGAAGFIIAALPFRHVGRLAGRPINRPAPGHQARIMQLRRVRWAVLASARRLPWRSKCFQQGLAAQFMLRRRGIPSVLHFGAAPQQNRLVAHVWVSDGNIDVVGGEVAPRFAILATFPSRY